MKKYLGTLAVVMLSVVLGSAGIASAINGAIYTTDSSGAQVNGNLYNAKSDVYLNGGPKNNNGPALPNGFYFFQVTNPSGSVLLSTDDAACRQLQVVNGVVAGAAASPSYPPPSSCLHSGSPGVQLIPFNDTPNAGGEYKVWLILQTANTSISLIDSKVVIFNNNDAKTDNFKVLPQDQPGCEPNCPLPPGSTISGLKFYDTNGNGVQDAGEPGIPGWKIVLFGDGSSNTTTDENGEYSFLELADGTYGVCEILPDLPPPWTPTGASSDDPLAIIDPLNPTIIGNLAVPPDSPNNDFGNVCIGTSNGKTLGFWQNKNGQALITGSDLCTLNNLHLRNANGSDFDPIAGCPAPTSQQTNTGKSNLAKWLTSASATNMAYMLSAQMATMELNVLRGNVPGDAAMLIGTPPAGCTIPNLSVLGFITPNNLIDAANSTATCTGPITDCSLNGAPSTIGGSTARSCQEFMKTAFDKGNNNQSIFVQPPGPNGQIPCAINYSANPATCAPALP